MTTATVVVCVYTEKRWDDIVAAVESVAAQDVAAGRDAGRRRPQPGAACERAQAELDRCSGAGQRARPGPLRRPQHRHRRGQGRRRGVPRRRRHRPSGLARRAAGALRGRHRAGGRRGGPPALAHVAQRRPSPARAARRRPRERRRHRRAGLDRRLHLHRPADRAGRGAQPHGLQHVVPARGVRARSAASPRRSAASARTRWAARRPSSASAPGRPRPARARRSGSCSSRAPRSTTASATTASNGPTCGGAAGRRACPRRRCPSSSAQDDALSTERDYVAKVLPTAVLRELRERHVTSAAAVVDRAGLHDGGLRPRQAAGRDVRCAAARGRWLSSTGRSPASSTTAPA